MRLIAIPDSGVGLRQGDLLNNRKVSNFPYGANLAVVITADCDLAQGKHYGQALMCPVLPANKYLEYIWCVKRLDVFRDKTLARVRKELDELATRRLLASCLTDATIALICTSESTLRTALADLNIAKGKIEELAQLVSSLVLSRNMTAGNFQCLAFACAHAQGKDVESIRSKIFSEFQADLGRDAIDIVAVHDDYKGDDVVHVILLRAPFSIAVEDIGFSKQDDRPCLRIGTFVPQVKYLITQKFGTLFSRVGLENEVELDRDAAIELLKESA